MPLVKCSVEQLEAAQRLYEAASRVVNTLAPGKAQREDSVQGAIWQELIDAIDWCREEFEKHGS